jgi:hypothetical protein
MLKRLTIALTLAVFAAAIGTPLQAAPAAPATSTQVPIVGTAGDQTFSGVFTLQRFATDAAGHLVAVGTIAGTLTNATGQITATGLSTVALPAAATGSCPILHLDLGPITLNLLGLDVSLSRVVLDITAVPGAGNLLGNLLCSVAGLLDNPNGLAHLLNQILGILQGL